MKKAPSEREEWETAIKTVHTALGLTAPPAFVRDVFIDVRPYCLLEQPGSAHVH